MDDFGSGYSSLHMLKEVPVDRIKLDLHFLSASGNQEKGQTIITYMIQMVHSLDLELIAEGVETKEQADFLKQKGNVEMQGYYFFKPMPVEQFEETAELNENAHRTSA
jgi:EAL domain-containing protein (putative c-di-GMP-specific phosphodiesterase class I)